MKERLDYDLWIIYTGKIQDQRDYRWSNRRKRKKNWMENMVPVENARIRVSTLFINDIDLMIFLQLVARPYTQSNLLIRFGK